MPYPGKRPYPNPLDASDADTDFDGDSLPMAIEYRLWRYSVAHNHAPASLSHMSYSDGLKYSIYRVDANEQRVPALSATNYSLGNQFLAWAGAHGYAQVRLPDSPGTLRPLTDFDRNGTADSDLYDTHGEYLDWSTPDGYLSDDERDEDGDGLSNYFEVAGSLQGQQYFDAFYPNEPRFKINYRAPSPTIPTATATACSTVPTTRTTTAIPTSSRPAASGSPTAASTPPTTAPATSSPGCRGTAACSRSTRACRASTPRRARRTCPVAALCGRRSSRTTSTTWSSTSPGPGEV